MTGDVLDDPNGFPVTTAPGNERNAALAWNGVNYQVAYEVNEEAGWFDYTPRDVYGTRVDHNGVVLEPASFPIEYEERQELLPAVAGGAGESVVVSSVFRSEAPYASYRLSARVLGDGSTGIPESAEDTGGTSGIHLAGSYPNPGLGSSRIRFTLPAPTAVSLSIYDVSGRLVRRLVDGQMPAGEHDIQWDGSDGSGHEVATGLYLYRLDAEGHRRTGKAALIR